MEFIGYKVGDWVARLKPARLLPSVALGLLTGWGFYWSAGDPRAAEIAHHAWQWLTPGWGATGRRALAVVTGLLIAVGVASLFTRNEQRRRVGSRLRSWPLMPTVAAAVVLGLVLVWAGYALIDNALHPATGTPPTRLDVLKTALTAVAGVGGAVALVVAYRRQRDLEQGRFIERFGAAAAQLGDADPAVRIAGVYAIASAADEATTDARRQQCIDVLCGYLRLPYDPDLGANGATEQVVKKTVSPPDAPDQPAPETTTHFRIRENDREVRRTITSVINAHLQPGVEKSWSQCSFNFTQAVIDNAVFLFAIFDNRHTTFKGTTFLSPAIFTWATFRQRADFTEAQFKGDADFQNVRFIKGASFFSAHFHQSAKFSACINQERITFESATFDGRTLFIESRLGNASFAESTINDETTFREAVIEIADFNGAIFGGRTHFGQTSFIRRMDFLRATYNATVDFRAPRKWAPDARFDWETSGQVRPFVWPQRPFWPPEVYTGTGTPNLPKV